MPRLLWLDSKKTGGKVALLQGGFLLDQRQWHLLAAQGAQPTADKRSFALSWKKRSVSGSEKAAYFATRPFPSGLFFIRHVLIALPFLSNGRKGTVTWDELYIIS